MLAALDDAMTHHVELRRGLPPDITHALGTLAADGACEDALDQQVIERVWKVPVRWIGEPRHRALVSR